jgi:hypothetical protein
MTLEDRIDGAARAVARGVRADVAIPDYCRNILDPRTIARLTPDPRLDVKLENKNATS